MSPPDLSLSSHEYKLRRRRRVPKCVDLLGRLGQGVAEQWTSVSWVATEMVGTGKQASLRERERVV
jgi:hypothetical protein